jgi:hypothetical protein
MSVLFKKGEGFQIPKAEYYVTARDVFLSGWGKAEGLVNVVVLPCRDYDEAVRVAEYARSRSDMTRVTIHGSKPTLRAGVLYSLMTRERAKAWYRDPPPWEPEE